jgi:hypothetical protein
MQRCSDSIGAIAGALAKAQASSAPGKIADRHHSGCLSPRAKPHLPLCAAVERTRPRPKVPGPA